jgi:23S rRNA pseudouridine1911/1915/1917 synthase
MRDKNGESEGEGAASRAPQSLIVPRELGGQTVERLLKRLLADRHPDHIGKLLRQRRVLLAGEPIEAGRTLEAGDLLTIESAGSERKRYPANRRIRLEILHEDDDLVVLVKPARMAMHPGPGHGSDTLLNGLLARYREPLEELGPDAGFGLVHRLDLTTSGVVVVALSALAYRELVRQFGERKVRKSYQGLVQGRPRPVRGRLSTPVGGQEAITDYRLVSSRGRGELCASQLELHPHTGRTHQLRIQLAEAGWPLVGDTVYGVGDDLLAKKLYLGRPFLHAQQLAFSHPRSHAPLAFEAPLPRDLRKAWKRLVKLFPESGSPAPRR